VQNAAWFTGYGIVAFGVIWVLPEDISKWPKDERELSHLLDAYRSPPVWDQDPWFWNYAVHPVLGAYSYLAERNYGEPLARVFILDGHIDRLGIWRRGVGRASECAGSPHHFHDRISAGRVELSYDAAACQKRLQSMGEGRAARDQSNLGSSARFQR